MTTTSPRRFSESHEWFSLDGDVVTIGISPFAASELTDITYVEMKGTGTTIQAGESVGEVESVKTTSEVFSVVGGEIIEVNPAASDDPSLLNADPLDAGWLIRIRTSDPSPLDALMDQSTYEEKHPVG
ncbi:MAG: glycine cleavage system protein GcvH [Planctomycetota bacterium]|jgi:glycine cleavage system H protein